MALDSITTALYHWFIESARSLPWRVEPANPYHIWLSEVMGQQTTLIAVIPYFQNFIRLWPRLEDLATATEEDILTQWAGLGYYARARNLHRCARILMQEYQGDFPKDETLLRRLPGLGDYAAAAITAIGFNQPAVVVDGTVARVITRLYALKAPIAKNRQKIREKAALLSMEASPRIHAEAMMDLGATICTPRNPACNRCPVAEFCQALAQGISAELPIKPEEKPRPDRHGVIFWLENQKGEILTQRRPSKGLLGGMMEFPSTPWQETPWQWDQALTHAPFHGQSLQWQQRHQPVIHIFTHFRLFLTIATAYGASLEKTKPQHWTNSATLSHTGLPSLMVKVQKQVQNQPLI